MKNRKRTIVLFLTVILSVFMIAGCQKKAGEKEDPAKEEKKQTEESILMAVGEETVSVEEAQMYAYFLRRQYGESMGSVIWDYELEGKVFRDYAIEAIQDLLKQVKITKQVAAKEGIVLSDDEMEEAKSYAKDYLAAVSEEDKAAYGLSEELLAKVYGDNILANKVFEISTNDVDTNISDDEVKQVTIQYLLVMTKGTDRYGTILNMTPEEKKRAKKRAKKLLKEAKDVSNFLTFAETNTDAKEVELSFSKKDAPEDLRNSSFQLKSGELSSLVEGEEGYYIIYCVNDDDEDATAAKKEELIRERQMASFERKFTQWSAEYEIVISTVLWNTLAILQ